MRAQKKSLAAERIPWFDKRSSLIEIRKFEFRSPNSDPTNGRRGFMDIRVRIPIDNPGPPYLFLEFLSLPSSSAPAAAEEP